MTENNIVHFFHLEDQDKAFRFIEELLSHIIRTYSLQVGEELKPTPRLYIKTPFNSLEALEQLEEAGEVLFETVIEETVDAVRSFLKEWEDILSSYKRGSLNLSDTSFATSLLCQRILQSEEVLSDADRFFQSAVNKYRTGRLDTDSLIDIIREMDALRNRKQTWKDYVSRTFSSI